MPTTRLLIVDDSAVIRRDLTAALAREPGLAVVGSASSGRVALMKIPLLQPDVVVLDIELPDLDALETLATIRQEWPKLPIIILNVPTIPGAAATVDALTLGASGYAMKPEVAVPSPDAVAALAAEVVSRIEQCCPGFSRDQPAVRKPARGLAAPALQRIDIVVIGVSTGGPQALMEVLPVFTIDFPVPILIVQHMPPVFTKLLAERLAGKARIPVAEGMLYQTLAPGHAWIAPGDFHMSVERDGEEVRIVTDRRAPENSCRPAADVLFRSVAQVYGPHVLAVVMTGMGQDGFRGCEQIRAAGGQVIVQDEASSVVWGMPGIISKAGLAHQIVPLKGLGMEIVDRVWRHRYSARAAV
jgi:two-component system, chemotaxis family, protein-glutamate methylesterase/glutaminase